MGGSIVKKVYAEIFRHKNHIFSLLLSNEKAFYINRSEKSWFRASSVMKSK